MYYVLVANPAACAESISLHTVCHHAIYIDRTHNAAHYLQSQDRIHRLGLPPKTVTTVEILIAPDSIDESIDHRLDFKIGVMEDVLNDKSIAITLSWTGIDQEGSDELESVSSSLNEDDMNEYIAHLMSRK